MPRNRILFSDRSINQPQDKSRSHTSSSCPHAQLLLLLLLLPSWTGTVYECLCSVDWVSRDSVELLETFPLTAHTICTLRKSPLLDRMTVAVSTVTHTHTRGTITAGVRPGTCTRTQTRSRRLSQHRSICSPSSSSHPGCWGAHARCEETAVCVGTERWRGGVLVCVCVCVIQREKSCLRKSQRERESSDWAVPQLTFSFISAYKVTSSFETCAAHLKISTARKFPTAGL